MNGSEKKYYHKKINTSKHITANSSKDKVIRKNKKQIKNWLIDWINLLTKNIKPLNEKYTIIKQDENKKEYIKLSNIWILKNKNGKQIIVNNIVNNYLSLPSTFLVYTPLTELIENIQYATWTDLVIKSDELKKVFKKIWYKVTDYRFSIDNYQKNKEIDLTCHLILKKWFQKIKINWKIKFNLLNKTILFTDGKILITKNFTTLSKILISKYLIKNWNIQIIQANWNIFSYSLNIDYSQSLKKIELLRKWIGLLKRTVFKAENIK